MAERFAVFGADMSQKDEAVEPDMPHEDEAKEAKKTAKGFDNQDIFPYQVLGDVDNLGEGEVFANQDLDPYLYLGDVDNLGEGEDFAIMDILAVHDLAEGEGFANQDIFADMGLGDVDNMGEGEADLDLAVGDIDNLGLSDHEDLLDFFVSDDEDLEENPSDDEDLEENLSDDEDLEEDLSDGEDLEKNLDVSEDQELDQASGEIVPQYHAFHVLGKLGINSDTSEMAELLRYPSTKSGDELTSLEDYVTRMKEGQRDIYYITGESKKAVENSPFLERLKKNGIEVLFIVDVINYYATGQLKEFEGKKLVQLKEFEGKKLVSATKEGLKIDDSEDEKEELKEKFEGLCTVIKGVLGNRVHKVIVSKRMVHSPSCIVIGEDGWTASMDKTMKVMEINPENAIMEELRKRTDADKNDKSVKDVVMLLFETSLVTSGFTLDDPSAFCTNMERIVKVQASRYSSMGGCMSSKKMIKINPESANMEELRKRTDVDKNDKSVQDLVMLLFDTSLLTSGFTLDDPNAFCTSIYGKLKLALNIDEDESDDDEMPALEDDSDEMPALEDDSDEMPALEDD